MRQFYCCVIFECSNILPFFQVLVTIPLTLLQKNMIQFNPPLPDRKLKAIHSLGAGIIEKVTQ